MTGLSVDDQHATGSGEDGIDGAAGFTEFTVATDERNRAIAESLEPAGCRRFTVHLGRLDGPTILADSDLFDVAPLEERGDEASGCPTHQHGPRRRHILQERSRAHRVTETGEARRGEDGAGVDATRARNRSTFQDRETSSP